MNSDGGDRVWDGDACQRPALIESTLFDGGDRVWDDDACQRTASIESPVSDGGDRICDGHSFYCILVHSPLSPRTFSFSFPIPRHNCNGPFWDVEVPIRADADGSHRTVANLAVTATGTLQKKARAPLVVCSCYLFATW